MTRPPPRHPRPIARRCTQIVLAMMLFMCENAQALCRTEDAPVQTIIVLSSDAAPYKAAEQKLRKELASASTTMRTVLLADIEPGERDALAAQTTGAIVAIGSDAASSLHSRLPQSAPLLYCMAADPAANGLTIGRNTPGICTDVPIARQVQLLRQGLPSARVLAAMYRSSNAASASMIDAVRKELPEGMTLKTVDLDKQESVASALAALLALKPDVVWTGADTSTYNAGTVKALLKDTLGAGVPVFGFSTQFVRAGAIIGVGVRPEDQGEQAAQIVLRFITDPGAATREAASTSRIHPPKVRVAVNTIVAKRLNTSLPQSFVSSADDTFQE